MSWKQEVAEIEERRRLAAAGDAAGVTRQHDKGRLTVRERAHGLLDDGSFQELGPAAGVPERDDAGNLTGFQPANFLLGFGQIDGRRVVVGGEDFTVRGGSPNPAGLRKSVYAEELAVTYRVPLVRLHEGGGGSVAGTGGKASGAPVGDPVFSRPRFRSVAEAFATVPVASAALGPVAGLPAARLVASHFTVMVPTAQVLVAGPAVVARALGKDVTKEDLGGPQVHLANGVIDNLAADEADAFAQIRRFLSYMPDNVWQRPARIEPDDDRDRREESLLKAVPRDRRQAFDMRKVIAAVMDRDSFFEFGRKAGPGQITGLARLDGHSVGILANDCRYYAGAMTDIGARKVRRLIELCDNFHLPVLSFVDEPGFMIGPDSEKAGAIRPGTTAVLAAATSRSPWASIVVRKSYGVAQAAHYGPDGFVVAWPSAELGALPVEGGVAVAFGRDIAAAEDPEARRAELEAELARRQSPFPRAESFAFHDIIDPRDTRPVLCNWLDWVQPRLDADLGPALFAPRP
ncbi:MAG: carboxyl transferase domain-containing protein [Alphaproteobacteria bacterium]